MEEYSEAKRLDDHIADRIFRIGEAMVRLSGRAIKQRWGIRHTDLRLLNILDGEQALGVREISRRAYLDQAWVSRTIKKLEELGLLLREEDPQDMRLSLVSLSDEGKALLEKIRPYTLESETRLLEGLDERQMKQLLDRLESNVSSMLRESEG